MDPCSLFLLRCNTSKFLIQLISDGIFQPKLFDPKSSSFNLKSIPICVGMVPEKSLSLKRKTSSFLSIPISDNIVPPNSFPLRSKFSIFMPHIMHNMKTNSRISECIDRKYFHSTNNHITYLKTKAAQFPKVWSLTTQHQLLILMQ